jgi:hypothetical protein
MMMPNVNCAYYLPTYGLIQDVAIPKFTSQLISHGIDFTINRSDNIIKTSYGNILLRRRSERIIEFMK